MEIVDFNDNFKGFESGEDILVDTGILFALLNSYDAWHQTVNNLFDNFVINILIRYFSILTHVFKMN
jgi:predicted nucleic acid-binding protein